MTPTTRTIPELIERARANVPGAIDELFARCRGYLSLIARVNVESWLQAKADASDLVQQTMMEAYRGFDKFHGRSEAEWLAWLKRILEHNAADFVRRFQGAKRHVGKEIALSPPTDDSTAARLDPAAPGDTPSQAMVKLESELQLAEALEKLTPDYREVIVLRNLQRLSFDEVAQRLDRSRPAAQMLWMRAMQKLQQLLQDDASKS
jgi:RNA polymerase sigma-70 factor (ECF subfamily)